MTIYKSIPWGVIFDFDGVIVDTNPWHRKAILKLCKRYENEIVELNEDILKKSIFGIPNREWIPSIFKTPLDMGRIDKLADEKERIFRSLILGSVRPLGGLEKLLTELRHRGIPVAVASSAPPENIALMLKEIKLAPYFGVVLDDTSVARGKPAPDIYIKAAQMLGVPPGQCIVFEDSSAGVEAGIQAGCVVVGITTTLALKDFPPEVPLVINNFEEVGVGSLNSLIEMGLTEK